MEPCIPLSIDIHLNLPITNPEYLASPVIYSHKPAIQDILLRPNQITTTISPVIAQMIGLSISMYNPQAAPKALSLLTKANPKTPRLPPTLNSNSPRKQPLISYKQALHPSIDPSIHHIKRRHLTHPSDESQPPEYKYKYKSI